MVTSYGGDGQKLIDTNSELKYRGDVVGYP